MEKQVILFPAAKNKTYGVVGLGKSGRATIASLLASGANVIAWDDSETTRAAIQKEFPAATLAPIEKWDFSQLTSLIMSPGILLSHPAVIAAKKANVEVIGDIELLYRAQPEARYIAITGTNGKSTTTSLIGHILKACSKKTEVGGNLGIPALALAPLGSDGFYVLELSSYQLDLVTSTKFQTAILLNITPDHLDHHGSMENYIDAKRHIFDRQTANDVAILGVDDATTDSIAHAMLSEKKQRVIPISSSPYRGEVRRGPEGGSISPSPGPTLTLPLQGRESVLVENAHLSAIFGEAKTKGDLTKIRTLQGAHNWQNAAAAYAACAVNGCTHEAIMAAMASYPGLAHRMEWLGETQGVQFVNDSKATNADAAEKALLTYDNIYWIAGGVAKEGGIEPLEKYFPKIRHAYLIGEAANAFAKTLEGHVPYTLSKTLENAFHAAVNAAISTTVNSPAPSTQHPAPTILLAPACASFDQFPNFEKRGEAFAVLVRALTEKVA